MTEPQTITASTARGDLRDPDLAPMDPFWRAMEILRLAGVHTAKISGTNPSGVRVVVEGGAPKPIKRPGPARKVSNRGGGL